MPKTSFWQFSGGSPKFPEIVNNNQLIADDTQNDILDIDSA